MAETAQKSVSKARGPASDRRRAVPLRATAAHGRFDGLASLQAVGGNRAVSDLLGGGAPLPEEIRAEMEMRFGETFADVRIHDDAPAQASAADLHAKAYTHGRDIVFNHQRYAPHSLSGKRLLAHELAHVVQQRRGGTAPGLAANAPHEAAADAAAGAVVAGRVGIAVGGATGVGVARDEDESWTARLRRRASAVKEAIPGEYREGLQKAGDVLADKAVDLLALPQGPVGMAATHGLGSSLLHGVQKIASGEADVGAGLRNLARDKAQQGLGTVKGVVTQLTEVADTGTWVGNEYKGLRDTLARKVGGGEGSPGNEAVKQWVDATVRLVPGGQTLPDLAEASDGAKKAGLVDKETGQASLSAPLSEKLNDWAKGAETMLGATPRDPEMFSPMEQAEITAAIGTQVALAFTGAEEVKVAMNVVGAIGGLRGVVETIRNDPNWTTSSRFWGSLIGMGLSIVGLKHAMAASKITTLVLKFGWVLAAIPSLTQLAADYWYLESHPDIDAAERAKREASIKQGWTAAIHVVKDAILHVAQSQGGKTAKPGGEEGIVTPKKAGGAAGDDRGPARAPTADDSRAAAPAKGHGASGSAPVDGGGKPLLAPAPGAAPALPSASATKAPAVSPVQAPEPPKSNLLALKRAVRPPESPASKTLEANLKRQSPAKAGRVTRLPLGKAATLPGNEPMQQKLPAVVAEPLKIAVGQTHGAEGGQGAGGKPPLRLVGGNEPTVASSKTTGSASSGGQSSPSRPSAAGGSSASAGKTSRGTSSSRSRPGTGSRGQSAKASRGQSAKGSRGQSAKAGPAKAAGPLASNAEPLVAVRVQGGGAARKGTFWQQGSPEFNSAATNKRFVVLPKSEAESLGFRPAGAAHDQTIKPTIINGVQVESNGAGTGKSNKHNVSARADIHSDPKVNQATFEKTIGASRAEGHGYKSMLQAGELGVVRPGNASTGGVDAITAKVGTDGKAKVYLNDFTGPQTSKGSKPSHKNWVGELGDAVSDPRFGFGNKATDNAIRDAIRGGEVYVRTVRVEYTRNGPVVSVKPPRQIKVPAAVKKVVGRPSP